MATPSSIQFIDSALSPTAIFQLSYTDYAQKRIIRTHLVSFLQGYSSFSPSIDNFTHDDGRTVMLLLARGDLSVSDSSLKIPVTIWLHENYPYEPPIVFVSSPSAASPITHDHPFVQPSGFLTIYPYLLEWKYPSSNVSHLVCTLAELFTLYYPFVLSYDGFGLHPPSAINGFSDSLDDVEPNARAEEDLIEQLSEDLLYHMVALTSKTQQETDDLMKIQKELLNRKRRSENLIKDLEHEKSVWDEKVNGIDVLMNWVKVNDPEYFAGFGNGKEESFEGADDISKLGIECLAADNAIEDLIYALGKTVEESQMSLELYMKMVRSLGREQFIHRATLRKINRLHLLDWAHSSNL